ncbi:MAG: hypothetical protein M3Y21_07080 [Candidatus Eremiobacteraeota bacterium]|nr:hypothetical protein [Candidatus Eremiobacteraeota bacterium]
MKHTLLRIFSVCAAFALIALPMSAHAAQPLSKTYSTSLTEQFGSPYPYSGTLQIQVSDDGIVSGYYRPADSGSFETVTGGRQGDQIWLNIGQSGDLRVTGNFVKDAIVGSAVTNTIAGSFSPFSAIQPTQFNFVATPSQTAD